MSTLPKPFTSLVGRDHDIAAVSAILESSPGSMVTLVGPAGVGKTRLAIAVAESIRERFTNSAVYVDLSAVTDPLNVLPLLAGAIGIPDGEGAAARLARFLADRSLLVVIDNFEQVRDAALWLNPCLAGADHVRVLVTSQAPLRVRGEREFAVQPLLLPDLHGSAAQPEDGLSSIRCSPAVELFVRRAQMGRPSFTLTDDNASAIVDICRQLDGLPLAIELAAARSNVLSPEALAARLSAPLRLLSGGPRDAPDRHQTLHSAIAWSYGLLSFEEGLLLERLSVFAGSFSLEAAEHVAGNGEIVFAPSLYVDQVDLPPNEPAIAPERILDVLDALVDHSLVQRVDSPGHDPRFRLFTTIRQFAEEKLRERGILEQTRLRHATWFRSLAEGTWSPEGLSIAESEWLGTREPDMDNFRAALRWLTQHDPATASTFAAAMGWQFYFSGQRNEGLQAFERTDGAFDPAVLSPVNRARNCYLRGVLLAHCPGREGECTAFFETMLAEVEAVGLDWAAGFALLALGVAAEDSGEYARALELFGRARPILDAHGGSFNTANLGFHMASALVGLNRLNEAREKLDSILDLDLHVSGANRVYALHLLGVINIVEGDLRTSAATTRQFLETALHYHMGSVSTESTDATATIAVRSGDMELGARLFGTADRVNLDADYAIQYPERPIYEAARATALHALGPERFNELYRAGSQLGFDAAMTLVRESLDVLAGDRQRVQATRETNVEKRTSLLTAREREVLQLVAAGLTDREIADRLFISHGTARTHVGNILEKLDVPSRSAATTMALREGLVPLEDTVQ
jgi:predicted ATPase/DNA-binding CsgD family transcriptional regulator